MITGKTALACRFSAAHAFAQPLKPQLLTLIEPERVKGKAGEKSFRAGIRFQGSWQWHFSEQMPFSQKKKDLEKKLNECSLSRSESNINQL